MRVARVLTRANLGGPARQVLASDPLLARAGIEVTLFVGAPEPGEGDLVGAFQARGLDVRRVPALGRRLAPLRDLAARRALARAFRELRPDVVHTHASKAGALGRAAARGSGARTVHTFHGHVLEGYFPPTTSRLLAWHERRLARTTDAIVAVSEATADDLDRLGVAPRERIEVVPPGVELDDLLAVDGRSGALRGPLGIPPDAPVVALLGRLAPVKRPELALELARRLADEEPRMHLVLVGDGALAGDLERRRAGLPEALRSRVHLAGAREDVAAVLADVDVLLSTSRSEGMPVALVEAAAAGVPAVATAVGGVPELVVNGVTGLLATEPEGLALALASLLDDADRRASMGRAARDRVRERHSAEALARRLEALYRGLLQSAG